MDEPEITTMVLLTLLAITFIAVNFTIAFADKCDAKFGEGFIINQARNHSSLLELMLRRACD